MMPRNGNQEMKLLSKFNVSSDGGPRKFSFELTMSGLVSLGIVLVLGISWVFILGILVGRGYRPEEAVPELAQIMPSSETPATLESSQPPTVLRPEELQFMEDLQNKTGSAETITVDSTQKPHAPKPAPALPGGAGPAGGPIGRDLADGPGARPAAAPAAQVKPSPAAPAASEPALAPRPPMPAPTAPTAPAVPGRSEPTPPATTATAAARPETPAAGGGFEATYQVASFYKRDQADAMIKKLGQKGFKAEIRPGKIQDKDVFRIAVTLRGTEQEIKAGLEKTGEKGPILLGKKPL
jgi:cell division septation protein DedD